MVYHDSMNTTTAHPEGVLVIDTHLMGRPHVVASYVLLGDEPALIDPGPGATIPYLEAGLAEHGLSLGDIRHIVITHIHLDHAGATGPILARYPNIQVHVHEKGAAHLVDPSRLVASATILWGDMMDALWGRTCSVPPESIITLIGGETLRLGKRVLRAYDAPGHAKHHLVWFDELSGGAFVGDNTGVRMPGMTHTRPAMPPPDVDIEGWVSTVNMIRSLAPQWLMPTHFGPFNDVTFHLDDFTERLLHWTEIVRAGLTSGASEEEQIAALERQALSEVAYLSPRELADLTLQSGDVILSYRGLARYWQKKGVA